MEKSVRQRYGVWYTEVSPFGLRRIQEWIDAVKRANLLVCEPFAGEGSLVRMLPEVRWGGLYDIKPPPNFSQIIRNDSLQNFPSVSNKGEKFECVITNPPWLSKCAAVRLGVDFPETSAYDNLYKHAVSICLANCAYVMAILPASFVTAKIFHNRLTAIVRLQFSPFGTSTEIPSVVALFSPFSDRNYEIWDGDCFRGRIQDLIKHEVFSFPKKQLMDFDFNSTEGELGLRALDTRKGRSIAFFHGSQIPVHKVKRSSRALLRIKLPGEACKVPLDQIIRRANKIIEDYRNQSADIALTASKSLRKDGFHRRRMDRETARIILSLALQQLSNA